MMLFFLLACSTSPPQSDEDCIPTTGDNCSCEPQCMTEQQIERAQREGVCDLACFFDSGSSEPNWECKVQDGECVVVE